ncbi:hypothetical protein BVRB_1g007990 [Beta vulgaris subsp. vulgaris]|nr:hypothetical protein BVRB_1g007990 [Beta vulgaris subsp. vulgaris]
MVETRRGSSSLKLFSSFSQLFERACKWVGRRSRV